MLRLPFQDRHHTKTKEEAAPLLPHSSQSRLLQLSEHELQVWSQFVTEGIVKNVFQVNLGTEHTLIT